MGERKCTQNFGRKNLKERDHLENLSTERMILKWILGKCEGGVLTIFSSLRIGTSGGGLS
jgi:hypothetical protein